MPAVIATSLVEKATTILIDAGNTRWSIDELIGWLNDAQRAVVLRRPDANAIYEDFNCAAGTKQILPAGATRLIDVTRNSIGGSITLIDRAVLDNQMRRWHRLSPGEEVEHYAYDDRVPEIFWLFPPPIAGHMVDLAYAKSPEDVAVVLGNEPITIADMFSNAILEYMLYRAFQKDAEYGANPQRAGLHWQAFLSELGDGTKAEAAMSPNQNG